MVVRVVEIKGFSREDMWKRIGIGTGRNMLESGGEEEGNEEQGEHVEVVAEKRDTSRRTSNSNSSSYRPRHHQRPGRRQRCRSCPPVWEL